MYLNRRGGSIDNLIDSEKVVKTNPSNPTLLPASFHRRRVVCFLGDKCTKARAYIIFIMNPEIEVWDQV